MTDPDTPKPWPPRAGWKFFLLWMLAEMVAVLAQRFFPVWTTANSGAPDVDWNRWAGQTVLTLPAAVWTGYLLFHPGWRLLLWVVLPAGLSAFFWAWIDLLGFGVMFTTSVLSLTFPFAWPALQTLLMLGVRRRVWAWLVVCLVTQLCDRHLGPFIYGWLFEKLSNLGTGLLANIGAAQIMMAAWSGISLLGAPACAYVLAFWMPPIARRDRFVTPTPLSSASDERT